MQQSKSTMYIHISILFQILFPYRLLPSNIILCYTVGPYYLSILYIAMCISQSQSPNLSLLPHISPLVTMNLFSKSLSLFLFCKFFCIIFPWDWAGLSPLPCWPGPSPFFLCCRNSWINRRPVSPFCILCKNQHPFPGGREEREIQRCLSRSSHCSFPAQYLSLWCSGLWRESREQENSVVSCPLHLFSAQRGKSEHMMANVPSLPLLFPFPLGIRKFSYFSLLDVWNFPNIICSLFHCWRAPSLFYGGHKPGISLGELGSLREWKYANVKKEFNSFQRVFLLRSFIPTHLPYNPFASQQDFRCWLRGGGF